MGDSSFGRVALAAAWLGGGGVLVALALWERPGTAERGRLLRFGVTWLLFGVAQSVVGAGRFGARVDRRAADWSRRRSALLGFGVALAVVGFVLSGGYLVGLGAVGSLLVAAAGLADRR